MLHFIFCCIFSCSEHKKYVLILFFSTFLQAVYICLTLVGSTPLYGGSCSTDVGPYISSSSRRRTNCSSSRRRRTLSSLVVAEKEGHLLVVKEVYTFLGRPEDALAPHLCPVHDLFNCAKERALLHGQEAYNVGAHADPCLQ